MSSLVDRPDQLERLVRQLEQERQRSADLGAALASARLQIAALEQRLREAHAAAPRAALVERAEQAEQYRIEAADLRSMFDAMQHRIDVLGERAAGESELRRQLAEIESQRQALAEEVEAERRARLELAAAASRQADDGAARAQLESLQNAFDAAVAKHAAEARALRQEAELHKALARDRESELTRLAEECSILQQSVEDTIVELEGVRAEHSELSQQLRQLEDLDVAETDGDDLVSVGAELRLAADRLDDEPALSSNDLEEMLGDIEDAGPSPGGRRILVLNLDDDPATRSSVERAVENCEGALYATAADGGVATDGEICLTVNLAAEQFDLGSLSDCSRWGVDEPEAFAYCAANGRGVVFRKVMFFPPPCDFDECAARLLSGADSLQRVLAVGEDVDFMSGLRESLGRMRTSTAIAFDGRQAVDLIPMVKPQTVIVDLNLPRGGGLRVASQVAAHPDLRNVAIAMFWSRPIDAVAFRRQAVYAVRDVRLDADQLTRSMTQLLNELSRSTRRAVAFAGALPSDARHVVAGRAGS